MEEKLSQVATQVEQSPQVTELDVMATNHVPQTLLNDQQPSLPLKGPLICVIIGIVLFVAPLIGMAISNATTTQANSGEAGWGGLILAICLWPIGFIVGVPGLLIFVKRWAQRNR